MLLRLSLKLLSLIGFQLNFNLKQPWILFFQLRSNESGYSSEGLGDCLNITRLRPEGSPMSIDSQGSLPGTRTEFYPGNYCRSMRLEALLRHRSLCWVAVVIPRLWSLMIYFWKLSPNDPIRTRSTDVYLTCGMVNRLLCAFFVV